MKIEEDISYQYNKIKFLKLQEKTLLEKGMNENDILLKAIKAGIIQERLKFSELLESFIETNPESIKF